MQARICLKVVVLIFVAGIQHQSQARASAICFVAKAPMSDTVVNFASVKRLPAIPPTPCRRPSPGPRHAHLVHAKPCRGIAGMGGVVHVET